jgi:hypothetical protein
MTAAAPRNTFKKFTNRSGLTKEEALARAADKDKDALSKMTEEEFQHTVLKPTGEVVSYHQESLMPQFTGKNSVVPITEKEYVEQFNSNLDLLNDIVSKRNKSGVEYKITGLTEDGRLMFETPKQTVAKKLSEKQQKHWDAYTKDADKYATERLKLRKRKDGKWKFETDETVLPDLFDSREDAMKFLKEEITTALGPREISGTSSWGVGVKPGQWRGEVEDIANTDYFRSLPGLEMRNTTASVFSDSTPRKGTGAYESINEYLKRLDLGRVKPGFNSQTEFSRGAWENFIKSGRGVGFYGNPSTIYGTMKTILPPAAIVGTAAMQEKKHGGVHKYQTAGFENTIPSDATAVRLPTLSRPLRAIKTEDKKGFDYQAYYDKANKYLSRPIFKGTTLTAKDIADAAQEFYGANNYEYPLDLLLTQGQIETKLGKTLKSQHNYFNVGNTDSGATRNFGSAKESVRNYMDLMYNDYLAKGQKTPEDLLRSKGFVNAAGNRYASNPNYETELDTQRKYINNYLVKQMGGSYDTNQEISMYEWISGRPEDSRKRYIKGGLKNRVLYNKAKYKR